MRHWHTSLVSAGNLCGLQGLFSEIDNLCTMNCFELQLMSMWRQDVVTSHGDGCLQTWKKDVTDTVISDYPYIFVVYWKKFRKVKGNKWGSFKNAFVHPLKSCSESWPWPQLFFSHTQSIVCSMMICSANSYSFISIWKCRLHVFIFIFNISHVINFVHYVLSLPLYTSWQDTLN